MQYFRSRKRERLVSRMDPSQLSANDQFRWHEISNSFDSLFKDFPKLRILKKYEQELPADVSTKLNRYKLFSNLELVVTISMLLFAAFAYKFCV